MYFPIAVDLGGLVEEFGLDKKSIDELSNKIITDITIDFVNNLKLEVSRTLKGTRSVYLNNLEIQDIDSQNREIILHGWLPNAIEEGYPAFDMKPGFSLSQKIKYNKDGGWFLSIPFHFGTPMSLGEGVTKIPKPIYHIVQKKKILRKNDIPAPFDQPKTRELVSNTFRVFEPYTHKSSIFEGLHKRDKGYMTFRRVGTNSDPDAFIHKGFKKQNFFGKTLDKISPNIPTLTENAINDYLKALNI